MAESHPAAPPLAAILWRDKWLLLLSLVVLWLVRLCLWLGDYRSLSARFGTPDGGRPAPPKLIARIAHAILRASVLTPHPTCLVQATAGRILLALRGFPSQIQVGVRKCNTGFEAHAWLVSDGRVVLGGNEHDLATFQPLLQVK